jgi:IclR family KDG regulon transcriptional repressor
MKAVNSVSPKDSLYSKSVLKTLKILDLFKENDELGIKDISTATNIPPSTVQRMVNTLVMRQYLQKSNEGQKYRVGMAIFDISNNGNDLSDRLDTAKRYMEEFTAKTRENINLAVLRGYHVIYMTKVDSLEILRPDFIVGERYPAFNTSLGRCMLAYQPWQKVQTLYEEQDHTQIPLETFKEIFEEVRKNGYATEDEQFQPGLWCTAAPVRDRSGRVIAALSTCIPKLRLDPERQKQMSIEIMGVAKKVSDAIG